MRLLSQNEAILIDKAQKGDIESFELLIENYQKKAFNIAYRMLGNLEDANDVTQEALVKVYRSIGAFRGNSSFSTWLYSIVNNTCIDFMRKNRKVDLIYIEQEHEGTNYQIDIPDRLNTPEKLLEKNEVKKIIHDGINQLNYDHRNIIILRDIQGLSYKEIGEILHISLGTVKSRISRARDNLKEIIRDNYNISS